MLVPFPVSMIAYIEEQHADDPRVLLDALLSGIAERVGRPAYRGCPFLNLMTEFPDQNHPGRVVARGNKEEMRARLATIVAKIGAADPNRVASQLALIINGAYATSLIAKPADLRSDLVDAAVKLLAWSTPDSYDWLRDELSNPQCPTVSTNPAATSRAHSSRSCITRRRSARRLTRAVPTGGTPISINLMRGLE
jgi:hypothetical protein